MKKCGMAVVFPCAFFSGNHWKSTFDDEETLLADWLPQCLRSKNKFGQGIFYKCPVFLFFVSCKLFCIFLAATTTVCVMNQFFVVPFSCVDFYLNWTSYHMPVFSCRSVGDIYGSTNISSSPNCSPGLTAGVLIFASFRLRYFVCDTNKETDT